MDISGLEDELRLAAGMPRLLYVKVPAPGMEPGLKRMLDGIRAEGALSYKEFTDAAELRELVAGDLATLLAEGFGARDGGVRLPVIPFAGDNVGGPGQRRAGGGRDAGRAWAPAGGADRAGRGG